MRLTPKSALAWLHGLARLLAPAGFAHPPIGLQHDNKRWSEITRASGMGMSYFTWSALEPWVDEVASALFGERAQLPWGV